jgi:hypothetical protein
MKTAVRKDVMWRGRNVRHKAVSVFLAHTIRIRDNM